MLRNRLRQARRLIARAPRPWFLLASLGINLPVFWMLANIPHGGRQSGGEIVIPVSIVERLPEPLIPEDDDTPAPSSAPQTREPGPANSAADRAVTARPGQRLRSPVLALAGEQADAALSEERGAPPVFDPAAPLSGEAKAAASLRAFTCNKLGKDRPDHCDDTAGPLFVTEAPGFAEEPDMAPKRWADFEIDIIDPEIQRIWAEDCPPGDGVIKDVFTNDTAYYRQGAHAGVGGLSANSINKRCP